MALFWMLLLSGSDLIWQTNIEGLSEIVVLLSDMVVTEKEHSFLLDGREARILHLDEAGNEVAFFGKRGEGPGELGGPFGLTYFPESQRLYVSDSRKKQWQNTASPWRPTRSTPTRCSIWAL